MFFSFKMSFIIPVVLILCVHAMIDPFGSINSMIPEYICEVVNCHVMILFHVGHIYIYLTTVSRCIINIPLDYHSQPSLHRRPNVGDSHNDSSGHMLSISTLRIRKLCANLEIA